jgi:hypothetical protein
MAFALTVDTVLILYWPFLNLWVDVDNDRKARYSSQKRQSAGSKAADCCDPATNLLANAISRSHAVASKYVSEHHLT